LQGMRLFKDRLASKVMVLLTLFAGLLILVMVAGLFLKSKSILSIKPITELIFSSSWRPLKGEFGFFPFIMGTLWVTGVAVIIAVPICLLSAICLSEYAPQKICEWGKPFIDVLAGIPSVIFGIWGVLTVVPLIKKIAPFFGSYSTGYCVLSGGMVLAIMIFPIIIHVSLEVLRSVPNEIREASLALGATKWQTIKKIVFRKAMPGIIAAVVLGLSRAFGETIAVLMVAGNVPRVPTSIFEPAYPLPALLANNYGEMLSIPMYDSALMFSALILLLVIILFNVISRLILVRVERHIL